MKFLKSWFPVHFPKVPPNHRAHFFIPTTTFSTSIYQTLIPTHYLLLSSFTSRIVDFGGITWILILFQTNNYRFIIHIIIHCIHCMYPFIHCIHYLCMEKIHNLLQIDYEHLMNNIYRFIILFLVPITLILY